MASSNHPNKTVAQDVRLLRQVMDGDLHQLPRNIARGPYLVVLSGLPGTGKSHFANELARRIPVLVVGSDRMRKALVSNPKYTRSEHARVFAACHQLTEDLLQRGHPVVFDATNLTNGFRHSLYEIAEKTVTPLTTIWFTAPIAVIRRRLDARAAGLTTDSYSDADWVIHCRLRPGEEPISGPHLTVDSSRDISPVVAEVVRLVESAVG